MLDVFENKVLKVSGHWSVRKMHHEELHKEMKSVVMDDRDYSQCLQDVKQEC